MYLSELNFPSGLWYKGFFVCCWIITHDFTLFSSSRDVTGVFYPEEPNAEWDAAVSTALSLFLPTVAMQQYEMLAQHDLDLLQQ